MLSKVDKLRRPNCSTVLASAVAVSAPLGGRALEAVSKFGLYALAARRMGPAQAGALFLCLGLIHLCATAARLGLEKPLTRHLAADSAFGYVRRTRSTAWRGIGLMTAVSALAALGLSVAADPLASDVFHTPGLTAALILSAVVLPLQNMAYGAAYSLIGLARAGAAQMVMNTLAPMLALLAIVCGVHRLEALLIAYAGAYGICAVIGLGLVIQALPREAAPLDEPEGPVLTPLLASAGPLYVVELSQAALISLPVVIIGHAVSASAVAAFSLANRLTMLVTTVVLSIGAVAAPIFAVLYRRGAVTELRMETARVFRLSIGFCLPLILVLDLAASPLLKALGAGSAEATQTLWILSLGQLVFCLLPCQDTLLAMTGHGAILRRFSLLQLALCLGLTLILTPVFGIRGAAAASATAWSIGALLCALAARRILRGPPV